MTGTGTAAGFLLSKLDCDKHFSSASPSALVINVQQDDLKNSSIVYHMQNNLIKSSKNKSYLTL